MRNDPRLEDVPIIMITSRVGEKHRARAIELGVNDYLGKPYQESQLLDAIEPLVLRDGASRRDARDRNAWKATAGNELYSLLVPLARRAAARAARVRRARSSATRRRRQMAGAPPWYLGTIAWNGRRVPLVSFEAPAAQHAAARRRPHAHRRDAGDHRHEWPRVTSAC